MDGGGAPITDSKERVGGLVGGWGLGNLCSRMTCFFGFNIRVLVLESPACRRHIIFALAIIIANARILYPRVLVNILELRRVVYRTPSAQPSASQSTPCTSVIVSRDTHTRRVVGNHFIVFVGFL
jgi:hypothetical protein